MSINSLLVDNFKGVAKSTVFDIAPITLFIGPNSSGKSSCVHALMALAQTLRVGKPNTHVVLDDENAFVHLGRFVEVIHSRDYAGDIRIGVNLPNVSIKAFRKEQGEDVKQVDLEGMADVVYQFKSTKRTQEVHLSRAILRLAKEKIEIRKSGSKYIASYNGKEFEVVRMKNYLFNIAPPVLSKPDLDALTAFFLLNGIQTLLEKEMNATLYLGPFRQAPARRYPFRGACPSEVGFDGGGTVGLLANEVLQSKKRPHTAQIGKWLDSMGLAKSLDVTRTGSSELFDVNIHLADETAFPLPDLGYGMSQVLPVLAQCSFAPVGATLLFEQPELHLHSGASRKLANVFAETVREKKAKIIAETHSRELFHEFMELVREGVLDDNEIVVYDVTREGGESSYRKISLIKDADGSVEVDHPWGKALA